MRHLSEQSPLEIALFARAPVLGHVKSRLAAEIGPAEALRIYEQLLWRGLRAVEEVCRHQARLVPVLWHLGEWPESSPVQGSSDLVMRRQPHERMVDNLREVFRPSPHAPRRGVVVIGADHPEISADAIGQMVGLLDSADVAAGPAEDGGFWALGAVVPVDGVCSELLLGEGDAFSILESAVRRRGYSFAVGPTLLDIDTPSDLAEWQRRMHRR